jgi:hypothetical protein
MALGHGVQAALENPAGMLSDPSSGFAFSHSSLFTGGLVTHQSFAICLTRWEDRALWKEGRVYKQRGEVSSAFGVGVTNLSGKLPDAESYGEMQVSFSYSRRVPLGLRGGFRLRFLQTRTSVEEMGGGSGYAFDAGVEDRVLGFRFGLLANALASDIRWDRSVDGPLPTRFLLSIEKPVGRGLVLMAGADLRSTADPRRLTVAATWTVPGTPLRLQGGPSLLDGDGQSHSEISAGTSIVLGRISAEYGMRTGPPGLGEIHRFGFCVSLP